MTKTQFYTLAAALLASMALSACTSTGQFASKSTGPVDPGVTFKNACNGVKIADGVFQAAVVGAGGKIPADDVTIEHDAYALVASICSGPVPLDLNSTLLAITADAAPIGALVSKYAASKPAS